VPEKPESQRPASLGGPLTALAKTSVTGNSRLTVVEDGQLQGMVGLRDLMHLIADRIDPVEEP
jgi:hypothetical protein